MGSSPEEHSKRAPNAEDRSSDIDVPMSPTPESVRSLAKVGASAELLDLDAHGFLAQLLLANDSSSTHAPLCEELYRASTSLFEKIIEHGMPRNPDAELVLKELFSPRLLREAISQSLSNPQSSPPLVPIVALCFISHPPEALQECRFLSRQLYSTPGQRKVWNNIASALLRACHAVPELWSALEPSQRRIQKGPDFIGDYLQSLTYTELLTLPAFIVDSILPLRKASAELQTGDFLASLAHGTRTILDTPGLLPILCDLRESAGYLSKPVVSNLVEGIRVSLGSYPKGCDLAAWARSQRSGEPRRTESQAESILRSFVAEVLSFEEVRQGFGRYGDSADAVISHLRLERSGHLERAQRLIVRVLWEDPNFRKEDIEQIESALEGYSTAALKGCIDTASGILAGESPPLIVASGCDHAMRCAKLGTGSNDLFRTTLILYAANPEEAYEVCIRVASRAIPEDARMELLNRLSDGGSAYAVLNAWEHLSMGEDLLFRVLIVHGARLGLSGEMLATACKRWSSLDESDLGEIRVQGTAISMTSSEHHSFGCVLTALSKIKVVDPDFIAWRTSILEQMLQLHWATNIMGPDSRRVILSLLYEGALTEELVESPISAGVRTNRCSLRLSSTETSQLDPRCQKALEQVNGWMNGAFSDYALERGLFTNVSMLLERYGQTRRTLRNLRRELKQARREQPASSAIPKLSSAINAFEKARRGGKSLENLRRRLAHQGLLHYHEEDVSLLTATETYLRRYGLEVHRAQRVPSQEWPTLMLIKKALRSSHLNPGSSRADGLARRRVPCSKEELARILAQCRTALESEFTVQRPHSFPLLLGIPAERRAISQLFGKVLLGVSLVFGVGGVGGLELAERLHSSAKRERQGLSGKELPLDAMLPNGSIPSIERPVAQLSRPFLNWRNSYLVCGLIGADPSMAAQGPLDYEGYFDVWQWLKDRGGQEFEESVTLYLNELYEDEFLGLPIGARVSDPTSTIRAIKRPAFVTKNVRDHSITLYVPAEEPVDQEITPQDLTETLSHLHRPLWSPRLPFSTVREVSPELADAIEAARAMPAVRAAEHLRKTVSGLLRYEHSPEYDKFQGTFEEYFRKILLNKRGICGQFAVVYDEALKQAGIPSCIASVYVPVKNGTTYTTRSAHATNIVILLNPKKEPIPMIFEATGIGSMPPASWSSDSAFSLDFLLPGSVVGGAAGLALLALVSRHKRRREAIENEALRSAREKPEDDGHDSVSNDDGLYGRSADGAQEPSNRIRPDFVLSRWILHHLRGQEETNGNGGESQSFLNLAEFDIEPALKAANEMEASLVALQPITTILLEKTGLPQQETIVGILNGWYRGMQDLEYRREWLSHLKREDLFSSAEAAALVDLAREVIPEIKPDKAARSLVSRWNPFYHRPALEIDCLLRAFTPLPMQP